MDADTLFFFRDSPGVIPLYARLEERILREVEQVQIRVQKTQIAFSNRHHFAFVSRLPVRRAKDRPKEYIVISFGLGRRLLSPRIDAAVEPYPNRWTHHVLLSRPEEIDAELLAWIREASEFSAGKRR